MEAKRLSLINPPKIKNLSYVVGNEPRSVTVLFVPRLRISRRLKNYFLVNFSTGCVILINNIKWYIFPLKSLKIMFSDLSLVIYIPYIFFKLDIWCLMEKQMRTWVHFKWERISIAMIYFLVRCVYVI